jgi:predicted nucleic acid-binding protein
VSGSKSLVLDANILIRAVFGRRVRALLTEFEDAVAFYCPDICLEEARRNIAAIAERQRVSAVTALEFLDELALIVEPVDLGLYSEHEATARSRMASRDVTDWPIVATALLLDCPIWTEDRDFFGSGVATWTTNNVRFYLKG